MIEMFCEALTPWQMMGLFLVLQISVVAGIAWLVNRSLSRLPARQHFVWLAALVAIGLALPMQWLLPGLQFEVEQSVQQLPSELEVSGSEHIRPFEQVPVVDLPGDNGGGASTARHGDGKSIESQIHSDQGGLNAIPETRQSRANEQKSSGGSFSGWIETLTKLYLAVVGFLMMRLLIGWLTLRRLTRNGRELSDSEADQLVSKVVGQLNLKGHPHIVISSEVETPMAFGFLYPTVLLPIEFEYWKPSCRQIVLAHELCHIKRRDAVWDLLARILGALYWFHPAVHISGRALRKVRETATDASVLNLNLDFSATDYARELLSVTSGRPVTQRSLPALPMAGQQDFKKRISYILSSANYMPLKERYWQSLGFRILVLTLFLLVVGTSVQLSVASLTGSVQETVNDFPAEVEDKEVSGASFYSRVEITKVKPLNRVPTKEISITGLVNDSNGNPVVKGIVIVRNTASMSTSEDRVINGVYGKVRTDAEGRYSIACLVPDQPYWNLGVTALSSKGEMGWRRLNRYDQTVQGPMNIDINLFESVPLSAQLVDSDGKPVSNTRVEFSNFIQQVPRGQSYASFNDRVISPVVVSDERGFFEFPNMASDQVATVKIQHHDFPNSRLLIATTNMEPWLTKPGDEKLLEVWDNGGKIVLDRGIEIGGVVVDSDSRPLADALVTVLGQAGRTDDNGNFELRIVREVLEQRDEARIKVQHAELGHAKYQMPHSELSSLQAKVTMFPPVTISGQVLTSQGKQPVSKIKMLIGSSNGITRTVNTDRQGRYSVSTAAGDITVKVDRIKAGYSLINNEQDTESEKNEHLIRTFKVEPGIDQRLEPFLLERLSGVEVRVVDINGDPIKGARVRLMSAEKYGGFEQNGNAEITEQDGLVELQPMTEIGQGSQSIVMAKADSTDGSVVEMLGEVSLVPDGITELTLVPATTIQGKVTWNGDPLPGVKLRITSQGPAVSETRPGGFTVSRPSSSYSVGTVFTNADGEYQLSVPRNNYLESPGVYNVGVNSGVPNEMAGTISTRSNLNSKGIYEFGVEFFSGEAEISGILVDSDGNPVKGGLIMVGQSLNRDPDFSNIRPQRYYYPSKVVTDQKGKFTMPGLMEDSKIRLRFLVGSDHPLAGKLEERESNMEISTSDKDLRLELQLKK